MPDPDWKRFGYSSLESYVEAHAGDCPPCETVIVEPIGSGTNCQPRDWPMPPHGGAGDEDEATPDE